MLKCKKITTEALIFSFLLLVISCSKNERGFPNEPDEFRDIKWGTYIQDLSDMVFIVYGEDYDIKIYKRENEELKIGEAELLDILYHIHNDKLFAVDILFKGDKNHLLIKNTLLDAHGKESKILKDEFIWLGEKIKIVLSYNKTKKEGDLMYEYLP
jgi:hypothetical protein